MQEAELIKKLKEKDEEAFRIIFNENQKKVINTCLRFVYDRDIAEDITQEVFIKVYSSISQFRGDSQLSTWIYRIAVTKSLDYLRMQKRNKRMSFFRSFSEEDENKNEIPAPEDQNPVYSADNVERMKVLNNALDTLPENQRVAFSLSKYDEISSKEIADILGSTVSAVDSLIHRAKKNLQKKLFNYYKRNL